jgi:hypothetical protein
VGNWRRRVSGLCGALNSCAQDPSTTGPRRAPPQVHNRLVITGWQSGDLPESLIFVRSARVTPVEPFERSRDGDAVNLLAFVTAAFFEIAGILCQSHGRLGLGCGSHTLPSRLAA